MKRVLAIAACAAWLSTASSASADGGPVTPSWDAKIAVPGSSVTYRVRAGGRGTAVAELQRDTGAVEQSRRIAGRFGLAGAAYDGSTTGLSADGATLVLAQLGLPRPHERTHLVVLDARSLSVRARIALPGFETVDAISPSGRWLYLIHYRETVGLHYEVRAYDLPAGHLLRKALADPEDRGEPMQGVPLTRTVSADGSRDYTLYLRANGRPFIHVLDTERVAAVCVDLPAAVGSAVSDPRLVLGPGGRTVAVQNRG